MLIPQQEPVGADGTAVHSPNLRGSLKTSPRYNCPLALPGCILPTLKPGLVANELCRSHRFPRREQGRAGSGALDPQGHRRS